MTRKEGRKGGRKERREREDGWVGEKHRRSDNIT
jgi:hypothetical protein